MEGINGWKSVFSQIYFHTVFIGSLLSGQQCAVYFRSLHDYQRVHATWRRRLNTRGQPQWSFSGQRLTGTWDHSTYKQASQLWKVNTSWTGELPRNNLFLLKVDARWGHFLVSLPMWHLIVMQNFGLDKLTRKNFEAGRMSKKKLQRIWQNHWANRSRKNTHKKMFQY